jgi:AcrR family transcriptional regulator
MVERTIRNKAKKAHTRMLLIGAAKKIFTEHGFEKSRITGITEAAGVSAGTFYEYFKNKDEIFLEIVKEVNRTMRRNIAAFNEKWNQSETLKERVRKWVTLVFDFFDAYPYCAPIIAMGGHFAVPVINQARDILTADIIKALQVYYRAGVKNNELRDLDMDIVLNSIFGTFSGVVMLYVNKNASRESLIEVLTEFIGEGILK